MKIKNLALFLTIGALSQLSVSVVNASGPDNDSGHKSKTLPSLRTSGATQPSDINFMKVLNELRVIHEEVRSKTYPSEKDRDINLLKFYRNAARHVDSFIEKGKDTPSYISVNAKYEQKLYQKLERALRARLASTPEKSRFSSLLAH